jgi:hypothetical protein
MDIAPGVFGALVHMGFKHTQARALIDRVIAAGAPGTLEAFLQAALGAT